MFKKYNSIENTYRDNEIEKIYLQGYGKEKYIVQEKVHGTNFSFITDGKTISVAKRTGLIEADEAFNNYNFVLDNYSEAIEKIFKLVKNDYPETGVISIFGELFGGFYNHPDVKRQKEMVRIQKGVFYSPINDFYAFDICVNKERYLDVNVINGYFETVGLFYAKTLFEGKLRECLGYPNAFESKIPEWLDLPLIENNLCEGVIIKPNSSKCFRNGSRVIFKNKNKKWSERSTLKSKALKSTKTIDLLSEEDKQTLNTLFSYVTKNRIVNVQSKLGEFSVKQIGKLVGFSAKDALIDFQKDYELQWANTEKESQKIMTKLLNNEVSVLVKKLFLIK